MADEMTKSVAEALTGVTKWQDDEQARHQAELGEVDQEMESLRTAMANLQQQLDALDKFREELVGKLEAVQLGVHQKNYDAVFGVLQAQAAQIAERSVLVAGEKQKRDAALEEKLQDENVKKLLSEFEAFKSHVEPTLASLPESYRAVVVQHHDGVREQLQTELEKLGSGPIAVEADEVAAEIVIAVDAQEGAPAVLMVILPVSEAVQSGWAGRDEDLQSWIAMRTMQGVYQVCKSLNLLAVQAMYGGHAGLLAVEAELGMGLDADVAAKLVAEIDQVLAGAAELGGAKVKLSTRVVNVDYLFPPEEEEEIPAPIAAETAGEEGVSNA